MTQKLLIKNKFIYHLLEIFQTENILFVLFSASVIGSNGKFYKNKLAGLLLETREN